MTDPGRLPGSEATSEPAGPELSRDLGFVAVFTTATGTMIGAGIFILPGVAAEGAGPGAALSFLFAGVIAAMAALAVCELATAMPKAGGPYYFVSRAMGPLMGTIVGLGAWLALILKGSFALVGLGQYVFHFSAIPILLTAGVGGALLLGVNLVGARATGALQNVIVVVLLGILGVFVWRGLFAVDTAVLRPLLPFGWGGVITTTGVVFISYLGIVKAAAVAEEVENPGRNLPLGILTSVALVTVLYVCTMIIVTGVIPVPDIVASAAPLADAGEIFLGAAGGVLVGVAGVLATVSTGNAAILSSSRYPFAMARDALMSPWIRKIHPRFRTPSRSIVVTGSVMIVLALLLDVEGLAKLGGVFGMLVFSLVNLSVVVLRWTSPPWYRPTFRVPLFPILPLMGAIAALVPIPQLGTLSHLSAAGLVGIGFGWYHWQRRLASRSGVLIHPQYSLVDKLQEIHQMHSLEDKKAALEARHRPEEEVPSEDLVPRVVVEVVEGEPYKHLLELAAACGRRYEAPVDVVTVTEVPYQSPLEGDLSAPSEEWLEQLRRRMREHGVPLRLHRVLARDRAHAVLSFVDPRTRVVLLEWKRKFRLRNLLGSDVDAVVRRSPARVAILKYRGHESHERILVATAGSPYATAEVELADAVAGFTGASLTFMMVLPPDASELRQEKAREYLGSLNVLTESKAELLLARGTDVAGEILAAGRHHDLIILGSTREISLRTMFGRHVVGRIADEIAERADGSVLITRDPGFSRRVRGGLLRWLSVAYVRVAGRPASQWRGSSTRTIPETRIDPFPRESDRDADPRSRKD